MTPLEDALNQVFEILEKLMKLHELHNEMVQDRLDQILTGKGKPDSAKQS